MIDDPIVDEVHRIRAELLAKYNGDLRALFEELQRRTEQAEREGRVARPTPENTTQPLAVKKAG